MLRELLADKSEHAVEKVYAEIGSRHRVKRCHIKITEVKEISAEQIENPILEENSCGAIRRVNPCRNQINLKRSFDSLSVEMRYLEQTAETLQQRISMVNAAIYRLNLCKHDVGWD